MKEHLVKDNIELFKLIVIVCGGCCLQKQIKEVLIKAGVYKNESDFYRTINKLEKNKLIVKKKLSSTNNYVIFISRFASSIVKGKEKNKVTALTQDIYKNRKKIFLSIFILEHLIQKIENKNIYGCEELFKYINSTTLRYRKNHGYRCFERLYKLNNKKITKQGLECYQNMKNRVESNRFKAVNSKINIEKEEINYSIESLKNLDYDSILSRHIYINLNNNIINIYFFDIDNNYTTTKAGEYIKDIYDLLIDTLEIKQDVKFNMYICTQNSIKSGQLKSNILDLQKRIKSNSYINESDFLLDKIRIHILNYDIQDKYLNSQNLIRLMN